MQVRTLSTGAEIHPPREEIVERTARQGDNDEYFAMLSNTMAWPALLRLLDRRDPSFRE